MPTAKIAKTIHVEGMLKNVPKTISYGGQSWEQAMGAHSLPEIKRDLARYEKMYPNERHIIVKSLIKEYVGERAFYWIYSRRR